MTVYLILQKLTMSGSPANLLISSQAGTLSKTYPTCSSASLKNMETQQSSCPKLSHTCFPGSMNHYERQEDAVITQG